MGILSIYTDTTGQVNVLPRRVKIISSDNLATVTAANYLNAITLESFVIYNTDIIDMWYGAVGNANAITSPGTYGEFITSFSNGVITLIENGGSVILPTVANAIAVFTNTTGTLSDNQNNATNIASVSSATPGTVRSIIGSITQSATTMTSGNIVGVRGVVNMVGSSTSAFVYGIQGKVIATGTLASGQFQAGVFGQADFSAATINGGQFAPIWGDYGTSVGTATNTASCYGLAMTNTTAAILGAQVYLYGGATNLFDLVDNNGLVGATYFVAAGTSGGSAGDASHCAASKVLKITVNATDYWIPLFASNS